MDKRVLKYIERIAIVIALVCLGYAYVHVWYLGDPGDVRGPLAKERYYQLGEVEGYLQGEFVEKIEDKRKLQNLIYALETAHDDVRGPALARARRPEEKKALIDEHAEQKVQVEKIVAELERMADAQSSAQEVPEQDMIDAALEENETIPAGEVEARTEPVENLQSPGE